MVKIRIKPKIVAQERQRETREIQEECCDEIQNLRCEMEMMKTAMDEMRRHMNEMQLQLKLQNGRHSHDGRCARAYSNSDSCDRLKCDGDKSAASDFSEWASGLELTLHDLEAMFESSDVIEWASKFIVADLNQRSGHPYPLCAIKGSRNELLMYDKCAWKKMTDQEFASTIVNKMFKKLLAVFTAWKNENYNRILTSEHFSTLYHSNYARILSFNENASKLKTKLFHMLL
jgi:hypothetical protein